MAHKKGAGSSNNGRESHSKRLGIKIFGGQTAIAGNILVRQRGTKFHAGNNVGMGKDHTLFAKIDGEVVFTKKKNNRSYISVIPFEEEVVVAAPAKKETKAKASPKTEAPAKEKEEKPVEAKTTAPAPEAPAKEKEEKAEKPAAKKAAPKKETEEAPAKEEKAKPAAKKAAPKKEKVEGDAAKAEAKKETKPKAAAKPKAEKKEDKPAKEGDKAADAPADGE